jgi:hypothetical protein
LLRFAAPVEGVFFSGVTESDSYGIVR